MPFVGELIPAPPEGLARAICVGSYSMRHSARRFGWQPGVFDLYAQDFAQQRTHWGAHLLNADSLVTRFQDASFTHERHFVRPTTDSKCFAGKVFERHEFEDWQRRVCALGLDDGSTLTADTEVQVARVVDLHAEYRYWVVRGAIVTRSLYKRGNRVMSSPEVDSRIDAFVSQRIDEWVPHEAFVVDVGETAEGLKVIELNTLNASGFYAGDVQKLVFALEAAFG